MGGVTGLWQCNRMAMVCGRLCARFAGVAKRPRVSMTICSTTPRGNPRGVVENVNQYRRATLVAHRLTTPGGF